MWQTNCGRGHGESRKAVASLRRCLVCRSSTRSSSSRRSLLTSCSWAEWRARRVRRRSPYWSYCCCGGSHESSTVGTCL